MYSAKQRGIEWLFTFESWWRTWEDHYHFRGRKANNYVMSRIGDSGPYSPQNVVIQTKRDNDLERERIKRTSGQPDEVLDVSRSTG